MKPKALEDDEDEEEPEWVDFDPKEKVTFFGREIPDESALREQF